MITRRVVVCMNKFLEGYNVSSTDLVAVLLQLLKRLELNLWSVRIQEAMCKSLKQSLYKCARRCCHKTGKLQYNEEVVLPWTEFSFCKVVLVASFASRPAVYCYQMLGTHVWVPSFCVMYLACEDFKETGTVLMIRYLFAFLQPN